MKISFQSCVIFLLDKPSNTVVIVSPSSLELFSYDSPILAVTTCPVYFKRTALYFITGVILLFQNVLKTQPGKSFNSLNTGGIFFPTLPIKSILQPTLKNLWRSAVRLNWNLFQSPRLTFPLRVSVGIGHFDTS